MIYPNPAKEFVVVKYIPKGVDRIELFDTMARLCYSQSVSPTSAEMLVHIKNLGTGMYELRLRDTHGLVLATTTFVKE